MLKRSALAAALATTLFASSCLGPNNAYRSLNNWNAETIEPDWLAEIAYIGMHIIPVYQVVLLGDILIFNTMGYWGDNPISPPGEFPAEEFQN